MPYLLCNPRNLWKSVVQTFYPIFSYPARSAINHWA